MLNIFKNLLQQKHPLEIISEMDRVNRKGGNFSHTTERFRIELLRYLMDNEALGPIIEVGTLNGGMTSLLAYVGRLTGRKVYGVDLMPHSVEKTKAACARHGVEADVFCGQMGEFFVAGKIKDRPDLIFIDSDHRYKVTLEELRVIHEQPLLPRCIALHDFNYRQHHQIHWSREQNPIAVDMACEDFFRNRAKPIFKRIGAFSGDGTVNTPANRGGIGPEGDYVQDLGSEGMMLFYP